MKISIVLQKKKSDSQPTATAAFSTCILWDMALGANKVVGIIVMMVCAYKWSTYLSTLHENHFWFSEIKVLNDLLKFPKKTCIMVCYLCVTGSRT